MKLDILAIGAHPDDVELSCSGTIINEIKLGKKVGIVDLTQGELGSRGSIESRYEEATKASFILGIQVRENLKMRDGFFENNETNQLKLISIIRKYQPKIILANATADRHPDHGRAAQLVKDACFLSGLIKVRTKDEEGSEQLPYRSEHVFNYIQDRYIEPDFVVDITASFEQRMNAIKSYASQFYSAENKGTEPDTYISTPEFFESITARARLMGKKIGVTYGEGFTSAKRVGIRNFDSLIDNNS